MKRFSALLAAIFMMVSFVACSSGEAPVNEEANDVPQASAATEDTGSSGNDGDKVEIRVATNWGPGDAKYDYFAPLFDEFVEAHKDTANITLETLSTEDYKTRIKVETASGSLPDIFTYWGGSMITDMVDADRLLNIEDYFADTDTVNRDSFEDGAFDYYTIQGETYGIPLEATRSVFLANSALFEEYDLEYPKTYEDLLAVSEVFKANGIIPVAMASKSGVPSEFFFSELYNQYAGAADELLNLDSTNLFATDNALKTASWTADMIENGLFPEDTVANGDWSPCLQLFVDGKAAMTYTYPWMFEFIPDDVQEGSEVIDLPMLPDADNDPAGFVAGFTLYGVLVNKETYHDDAKHEIMLELCDFFTSDELTEALTQSGMIPAKKVDINMDEAKTIFKKMMEHVEGKELVSSHYVTFPENDALLMMDDSLDELYIQAITPEEFVEKVQAELDK